MLEDMSLAEQVNGPDKIKLEKHPSNHVPSSNEEWGDVTPAADRAKFMKNQEDEDWGDLGAQTQPGMLDFKAKTTVKYPEPDAEEEWKDFSTPVGKSASYLNLNKIRKAERRESNVDQLSEEDEWDLASKKEEEK